jgi:hypothetical protein
VRGRGKYYSGVISRCHLNGTHDIDYEDGEKEMCVSREMIKVKGPPRQA